MKGEQGHRVVWFAPDRPVNGGTVFVRPGGPCHEGAAARVCGWCADHGTDDDGEDDTKVESG